MIVILRKILFNLPPFPGKNRLARLLLGHKLYDRDIEVYTKDGTKFLLPNIIENIGFELFVNGFFEKQTISFILEKLPAGSTQFIDIGANIGSIGIPVARFRTESEVLMVEASSEMYRYLSHNAALNGLKNIKLLNRAVYSVSCEMLPFFSPKEKYGKGSLSPVYTHDAELVESVTLDDLVQQCGFHNVSFIKVDVEGYEYNVFKGGAALLTSEKSPDILFEFLQWAEERAMGKAGLSQQILLDYGYKLFQLTDSGRLIPLFAPVHTDFAMIFATKSTT